MIRWRTLFVGLVGLSALLMAAGVAVGSTGWSPWWGEGAPTAQILWDIRAPRSLGAWAAGALLGLAGAISQGLFRNPLADPYLLGSSAGAALGVALLLAAAGAMPSAGPGGSVWSGLSPAAMAFGSQLGLTGAAFVGAALAVGLTLSLARGVSHTLRLLLAGVVVGVVLSAITALVMLLSPEIMRVMQAFMLGTTGFLGWHSTALLLPVLAVCGFAAVSASRSLDALTLGEAAAASLGVRLPLVRTVLVGALALATGAAVAQAGLIAFVGLVAPHLVRGLTRCTHGALLVLSALAGGALLLAADIASRWAIAPQELPVGVVTAVLGGGYLLWLMNRRGGL